MFHRLSRLVLSLTLPFWILTLMILQFTGAGLGLSQVTGLGAQPAAVETGVLIDAILFDGYESGDLDEAVRLLNGSGVTVALTGWAVDDGTSTLFLPVISLPPWRSIWLARDGLSFVRQFGFPPDFELNDSVPDIPQLTGIWPGFANAGDEVRLMDETGMLVDCLVYGGGDVDACGPGWQGAALSAYQVSSLFASEGQILYRIRDQQTALPPGDTNGAADWAQSTADPINGRKVQYPGWDSGDYFFTRRLTETAVLTVAIAPDNAYSALLDHIDSAMRSIDIETLTFENVAIGAALEAAAGRGVEVTILLEGGPAGGISDQEKYLCQRLEEAGGACWFMVRDEAADIHDRYRFLHAKFILVDGERVSIASENLSPNSLPDDDKQDGTWGRRGIVLITDAPGVVAHVQSIFARDHDVGNHTDLRRWQASDAKYGPPRPGFIPVTENGGVTYTVRFPEPVVITGTFAFELVQAPENSLRDQDGLLGLLRRLGAGDRLLVQQLVERPYWGPTDSNSELDPNPRLEAYLNAARRGTSVRILLDAFFDDPAAAVSNRATCLRVRHIAWAEDLNLDCALGNPAGLGIHNKMVLAQIGGRGYVHVGSLNGTELSHKGNREVVLQVQSNEAYALLANMFEGDWPRERFLPAMFKEYLGPATHILISEVHFNPAGPDADEFVELVNPTGFGVDLSGFGLGDAANRGDFEDVRRFPEGTVVEPYGTVVVATTATAFQATWGFTPDFEVLNTDAAVVTLIDDPDWGDPATFLQLGNSGDEVILRDRNDRVVDVVAYGSGRYPGQTACPLAEDGAAGHSLERFPYWRDRDDCLLDFRDWPFPNPGLLP